MPLETPKTAGDDIDSRCLKCKAVTNHTIIAIADNTIAKVQCNSCGGRHNYRPPVAEAKKSSSVLRRRDGTVTVSKKGTSKKAATPSKKVSRGVVNFDTLIKARDTSSAIPYTINSTLATDDLVNHSKFGLGVVTSITLPNKAQITFRDHGTKLLICQLD